MKILFMQTGGTIDKDYFALYKSYAFEINEPAFNTVLQNFDLGFEHETISVLKKDSLDITEEDRELIKGACVASDCRKIIITHGTDTMVKTAEVLSTVKNKCIVLTGAFYPEKMRKTDALFNIGTAVGAINVLNDGVYIAMNGTVFNWNNAKKTEEGKFVTVK